MVLHMSSTVNNGKRIIFWLLEFFSLIIHSIVKPAIYRQAIRIEESRTCVLKILYVLCFSSHVNIHASIFRRCLRLIWLFVLLPLLSAASLSPPLQSVRAFETGERLLWQLCLCSDWMAGCCCSSHRERRIQWDRVPHLWVFLRDVEAQLQKCQGAT